MKLGDRRLLMLVAGGEHWIIVMITNMAALRRTHPAVLILCVLTVCTGINQANAELPDRGIMQGTAGDIRWELQRALDAATARVTLQEKFAVAARNVQFQKLNGQELLREVASNLGQLLGQKLASLKESVKWAEEVAKNYTWDTSLQYGQVDYVSTKNVNLSDPAYEESEQFRQRVNFENSSVHIPVEIYSGDNTILNNLAWTSQLDEQWKINRGKDPSLLWQYFGSDTGVMRNYPASIWTAPEPDLYDVRRRPWYTQGASSPKDMLILIDTSGSTQGQALTLMKQAAYSLLDTLGDNDYVMLVNFAAEAHDVVGCFDTFVQATYWNKLVLREYINRLKAQNMANYFKAFEYAFEKFQMFNETENRTAGDGANCNKMIMFLTDGGTEMPQEVFTKYNSDQRIRIFTYAVGPTAGPVEAVRWIACQNRGYFDRIPAMGAIRSKVQDYVRIIAKPMNLAPELYVQWSDIYLDAYGLGMMTTVTLPVYNRSLEASNQTILGVMGSDVRVVDMEELIPVRKIGANGYMMSINSNGFIVFHPDLVTKYGWVADPANVDLLDVEYTTPEKEEVRKAMIDQEEGEQPIESIVYLPDGKYIDNRTRIYHYMPIPNSTFSLGLVLPEYTNVYPDGLKTDISMAEGIESLTATEETIVVLSDWDYCSNLTGNGSDVEQLIGILESSPGSCDMKLVQELFSDAKLTKEFVEIWKTQDSEIEFQAQFVATSSGVTRVFPANATKYIDIKRNPWDAMYFRRALDTDHWLYSPQAVNYDSFMDENDTIPAIPLIMATRAITITVSADGGQHLYKPAVVGGWISQDQMRKYMDKQDGCTDPRYACYFLDDGGYIILVSELEDEHMVGQFFGAPGVEPDLMEKFINKSGYIQNIQYDYQAACQNISYIASAGTRLYIPSIFYDILTVSWWTSKFTWSILNFNFINWLFTPSQDNYAYAQYFVEQQNVSCVKELAQYMFNSDFDKTEMKTNVRCHNCSRDFVTVRIMDSNLYFVIVKRQCSCPGSEIRYKPVQVTDPNFAEADSGECRVVQRYRRRPPCYDFDPNEDTSDCSGSVQIRPSIVTMATVLLVIYTGWKFNDQLAIS